jgi:hypothetical protein
MKEGKKVKEKQLTSKQRTFESKSRWQQSLKFTNTWKNKIINIMNKIMTFGIDYKLLPPCYLHLSLPSFFDEANIFKETSLTFSLHDVTTYTGNK